MIVCTVTGSTHAGMIAGTALEGRGDRRVIGIDASKTMDKTLFTLTSQQDGLPSGHTIWHAPVLRAAAEEL